MQPRVAHDQAHLHQKPMMTWQQPRFIQKMVMVKNAPAFGVR